MNQISSGRILAVALTTLLTASACDNGNRPVPYDRVQIADPLMVPPQNNVNTNNPTLTVASNDEVSPGDMLTLVWSDEFDGASLDPEVWYFETGDGSEYGIPGWGNNELQYYLPDSAQLDGGLLTITAREEQIGAFRYTSARLNTRDRFAFQYGRIEARMRLPGGQGLWPAFWLLPQDSPYGGWAASGEIDIMEAVNLNGGSNNSVYGTIHYGGEFPANLSSGQSTLVATDATADFHTYAIEWDATEIRWYVDDVLYHMENNWSSTAAAFPAPFDQPFHILFNVAVGGNWPGSPDAATVFPVTMDVDWVRVYSGEAPGGGGGDEPAVAAPTPTADPADVISLFSDAYTDIAGIDYNPDWGQATVVTQEDIAGNNTLKYANLNYQGTDFTGNPQDVSGMDTLHLDFWTADATALNIYLISSGPVEAAYALPVMPNTWVSVDIPLTEFAGVDLADVVQVKFDGDGTVFLDNLFFEASASSATEPDVAAPTPTADAANVISLFSDAYTDIAGIDYNPNWGQATVVTQESVAGNNTLKYAGLNYQGTDFAGNAQDVSGMDTLHLDFWTADSTTLNLSLISSGPVETAYALSITPGTWVSVDIPLTEFGGVDLTDVIQVKLDGDGTVWLDNMYFESAGGSATEPSQAAPTPTAAPSDVISLFSDAYADIAGIDYNPNWGQATVVTQESVAGNNTLKYAGLNYQGTDFSGNAQDVSGMATLHLDFWTADSTVLNVYLISTGPVEMAYALTITPGAWASVDIPLTAFAGVDLTDVIQLKFDGDGTVWLDNMYFESAGAPATEPTSAAPTPTVDAANVISLFSDAYTDIAGIDYNPSWGQATVVTQESIAGNNTLKYAGLNYQGTDFSGNAQDVSGMDTLHLDFWTADSTALNVFLISSGPVEAAYALTITPGTWVSVDIPLTAFAGVDLTDVIQLKMDGDGTVWLDNLYFSSTGGGSGGELTVNGDFETGNLNGWETFDNGGSITVTSPGAGGAGSAGNLNVTIPGNPTLKQANVGVGQVSAGQQVTVSFDWKGTAANGGVIDVVLFSELSGGGVSQTDQILDGSAVFPADWTTVGPMDITVGPDVSGGITLQITAICGGAAGCESDVYIDNASITIP